MAVVVRYGCHCSHAPDGRCIACAVGGWALARARSSTTCSWTRTRDQQMPERTLRLGMLPTRTTRPTRGRIVRPRHRSPWFDREIESCVGYCNCVLGAMQRDPKARGMHTLAPRAREQQFRTERVGCAISLLSLLPAWTCDDGSGHTGLEDAQRPFGCLLSIRSACAPRCARRVRAAAATVTPTAADHATLPLHWRPSAAAASEGRSAGGARHATRHSARGCLEKL